MTSLYRGCSALLMTSHIMRTDGGAHTHTYIHTHTHTHTLSLTLSNTLNLCLVTPTDSIDMATFVSVSRQILLLYVIYYIFYIILRGLYVLLWSNSD